MTSEGGREGPAPSRVLWVLRHAKAVADPPSGGTDHDRVLAPRGRRDAEALGRRLAGSGDRLGMGERLLPEAVVCSTAARTVGTAERVVAALAGRVPLVRRRSLYGASPEAILDVVGTVDDAVGSVMVVGHNPGIEGFVRAMVVDGDADDRHRLMERGLVTCALAVLRVPAPAWSQVEPGTGTLVGLFAPPY